MQTLDESPPIFTRLTYFAYAVHKTARRVPLIRLQIPDPTAVNNQIVVTFKLNEALLRCFAAASLRVRHVERRALRTAGPRGPSQGLTSRPPCDAEVNRLPCRLPCISVRSDSAEATLHINQILSADFSQAQGPQTDLPASWQRALPGNPRSRE